MKNMKMEELICTLTGQEYKPEEKFQGIQERQKRYMSKDFMVHLDPGILNPVPHITESEPKQTTKIISASELPEGVKIETPQGSSIHLSME
jgi:hypothetical protein